MYDSTIKEWKTLRKNAIGSGYSGAELGNSVGDTAISTQDPSSAGILEPVLGSLSSNSGSAILVDGPLADSDCRRSLTTYTSFYL